MYLCIYLCISHVINSSFFAPLPFKHQHIGRDYGYQLTAMGNRTVLVDNNTWNNTHIATVGRAMALPEDEAYKVMQHLDVDYVLVIFGGLAGTLRTSVFHGIG